MAFSYFNASCWVLLALVSLPPPPVWAQATGTIVGIVNDPTEAVIPGAKITAARLGTEVSQSTVTSCDGTYIIPNLVVGTYNVTADAQGFKTCLWQIVISPMIPQKFRNSPSCYESAMRDLFVLLIHFIYIVVI